MLIFRCFCGVFILPMRNWNSFGCSLIAFSALFSSYLWGIETYAVSRTFTGGFQFSSYLWGIETLFLLIIFFYYKVFILPMRNWNWVPLPPIIVLTLVFILPMRNWNSGSTYSYSGKKQFSSYLWGIETRWNKMGENRMNKVFILPMRNWNIAWKMTNSMNVPVFILPMRNWNTLQI